MFISAGKHERFLIALVIQEQANEREQEREDHQQEVKRLTKIIQEKEKRESAEGRLQREVRKGLQSPEGRLNPRNKTVNIGYYMLKGLTSLSDILQGVVLIQFF